MAVEDAIFDIKRSDAEAVVMIGTYDPCAKFIRLARKEGYNPIFHAVSFVGPYKFADRLGEHGNGVIVTQVVPEPIKETGRYLTQVEQYRRLLAKYSPDDVPSFVGLEGFVNAQVLVLGLKKAGRDLTREKFISALESLDGYSLGIGSAATLSSTDHQALDMVYFTRIKDGRFLAFADWDNAR